ncbi:hypothetical protein BDF20DRAFT_881552, partial [Mycotypha africana]|uniref:uncharacterized protein n=1 Tax=Mycotypha africana TaxID=64632 RepID=UPI0023008EFA
MSIINKIPRFFSKICSLSVSFWHVVSAKYLPCQTYQPEILSIYVKNCTLTVYSGWESSRVILLILRRKAPGNIL